jgi:hypothetical protein
MLHVAAAVACHTAAAGCSPKAGFLTFNECTSYAATPPSMHIALTLMLFVAVACFAAAAGWSPTVDFPLMI